MFRVNREVVVRRGSVKKVLWKNLQSSQENTCVRVSFLKKINFIKKEDLAWKFSCEFWEIFRNSFFIEHLLVTASVNDKECHWCRCGVFIVNFEHISYVCPVFLFVQFEEVNFFWEQLALIKGALSGLRKCLATESPLKLVKKGFCFALKALFVLKVFKRLSWLFGHIEK